jgi:O-antigen/teichoic acid export membrane protein
LSKQTVAKGATYLYVENIGTMISGYIFWLILSKITTTDIIGFSSTVISLATIFSIVACIDVSIGTQRFLGKNFSEQKLEDAKVFVKAALLLMSIGITVCSILILAAYNWFYDNFKIDFNLILLTILFMGCYGIMTLFRSIIIASLKTKTLPIIVIISAIAKLVLTVILISVGTGVLGLTFSFTFFYILASLLLSITIIMIFKPSSMYKSEVSLRKSFKNIFRASVSSWIPHIIYMIGTNLGTLSVFGSHGASDAGVYFIAFSLVIAISASMSALFAIVLPTLSGMQDGRKRFAWRAIKINLIGLLPLSFALMFYSKQIMQLFGEDYIKGSSSLEILLLSMLPFTIMTGITTLIYSYGNYKQFLIIGLATNIPRAVLYILFVPFYDSTGAAISYTIGAIIGLIASIVVAKKIGMQIFWKDISLIAVIPAGSAFLLSYFGVNYLIGISLTLVVSYLLLLRMQIITRTDVQDSFAILPSGIAYPILNLWNILYKKVNKTK